MSWLPMRQKGNSLMRKTLAGLALCAGLALVPAHAEKLTPDQRTICKHLLLSYPTPAPLDVALGTPGTVLFRCQDQQTVRYMDTIVITLNNKKDLAWWVANSPGREVVRDEEDELEDFEDRLNLRPTRAERGRE